MAGSSGYRPAGLSDSESEEDFSLIPRKTKSIPNFGNQKTQKNFCRTQHPGTLDLTRKCNPNRKEDQKLPTNDNMNSKKRRSLEFFTKKAQAENRNKNLPPVKDPKENPETKEFFQFASQTNMNLRKEIQEVGSKCEYTEKVHAWQPKRSMVNCITSSVFANSAPEGASKPVCTFKNFNVYFIGSSDTPLFLWMMEIIEEEKSFALDLENHESHSFYGMTALIQIATRSCAFLIDPHSNFQQIVENLKPLIESPEILKLMLGMSNDLKNLIKDFGIWPVAVLDLQQVHNDIRQDKSKNLVGLDNLGKLYIPNYQLTTSCTFDDWRRRPLTMEMVQYAANDVITVVMIWERIKSKIKLHVNEIFISRNNIMFNVPAPNTLKEVFQSTKNLMAQSVAKFKLKTYPTALEELKSMKLDSATLDDQELHEFQLLHQWRDRYSRIVDDVPGAVASSAALINICKLPKPRDFNSIKAVGLPTSTETTQIPTILRVLEEENNFFERLNTFECHKCIKLGHAAPHCPFTPMKASTREKKYMEKHPEKKAAQNKRRNLNKKRNKKERGSAAEPNNTTNH